MNTKFLDNRHYLAVFTDFPLLSIIGLRPEIVYVLNWIVLWVPIRMLQRDISLSEMRCLRDS